MLLPRDTLEDLPTTTDFGTIARDHQLNTGTCSSFGLINLSNTVSRFDFEQYLHTFPNKRFNVSASQFWQ